MFDTDEHYVYMENSMDSFWPRVFETIFTRKWFYMEITMDLFGEALLYWDRKYRWQVFLSQKFIDFLIP